jgi:hypothetical protein
MSGSGPRAASRPMRVYSVSRFSMKTRVSDVKRGLMTLTATVANTKTPSVNRSTRHLRRPISRKRATRSISPLSAADMGIWCSDAEPRIALTSDAYASLHPGAWASGMIGS